MNAWPWFAYAWLSRATVSVPILKTKNWLLHTLLLLYQSSVIKLCGSFWLSIADWSFFLKELLCLTWAYCTKIIQEASIWRTILFLTYKMFMNKTWGDRIPCRLQILKQILFIHCLCSHCENHVIFLANADINIFNDSAYHDCCIYLIMHVWNCYYCIKYHLLEIITAWLIYPIFRVIYRIILIGTSFDQFF